MSVWQLFGVGLVMLLGLLGVLAPGVPGPAMVWAAVAWWALTDTSPLAWGVLAGATAVLLLNRALRPLLPARRPAASGAPQRMRAVGTPERVELYACLLVVGAWLGALLWG
ncbi:DUF456 domain-containing protein [Streptomyces beijiangensis]|uniref:DUF456 domain-containing protein n=1 Tax=Streptomyces beijiangensis TaxID=163361 RepID=A0A939F4T8_9ACTN|nr:DUF456 domain-containing protein [Streptomyces beijiangensis]MBO0511484.1 DUF456 domain-containing protein [Streptomyces beijiangensis]